MTRTLRRLEIAGLLVVLVACGLVLKDDLHQIPKTVDWAAFILGEMALQLLYNLIKDK